MTAPWHRKWTEICADGYVECVPLGRVFPRSLWAAWRYSRRPWEGYR